MLGSSGDPLDKKAGFLGEGDHDAIGLDRRKLRRKKAVHRDAEDVDDHEGHGDQPKLPRG